MRRSVGFAFVLFCLLSSCTWLLAPVPELVRIVLYAVVGLSALFTSAGQPRNTLRSNLRLAFASMLLVGLPSLIGEWVGGHISKVSSTVVFAFVPLLTMLVVAYCSESGDQARRLFLPVLLALGGLLLLAPFDVPSSMIGRISLGALIATAALVSISGVWIHQVMRERKLPEAMAVVCLSNAALLFCGNLFNEKLRLSWDAFYSVAAVAAEGLSLVQFLLFIWLLREMPPERFAGRFLLIPLLTISEGYILLWPELTVRMGAGLLALAIGAVWIPFSSRAEDAPSLSLR